jgi:integrase/recombinase XerD
MWGIQFQTSGEKTMTELRKRMIESMQLRGLSEKTQGAYLGAVRRLAKHYNRSPDEITEEELRQYFLHLKNVKHYSRSSSTIAICGIKLFYERTLGKDWPLFKNLRAPREKKLPTILSHSEVKKILGCLRVSRYKACLTVIYSCGLRLQEGVSLQVADIDRDRPLIHLRRGKGAKDRYVPLPERTRLVLRAYWLTHQNPVWIFPSSLHCGDLVAGKKLKNAQKPINSTSLQNAFRAALKESGLKKRASIHTLRHSWATHLLEAGVNIRLIQQYLGHRSLTTTSLYTHLTTKGVALSAQTIDQLMSDLSDL